MTKHSPIGPSSCYRWWECPGSIRLLSTIPPKPPSPFAAEGTAAHELAERCLRDACRPDKFKGEKINGFEVTENMIEAVEVYLDTIVSDMKKLGLKKIDLMIEQKVQLKEIHPDLYGTLDAALLEPFGSLYVYDYKHGQGVAVDVTDNKQMMIYTLGIILKLKLWDYKEIVMTIVQPRAPHRDGPVRRAVIQYEELKAFADELKIRAKATEAEDSPLNAGPWCKFCEAAAGCPKLQEETQALAKLDFQESPKEARLPDPMLLPREQLEKILNFTPVIDNWLRSVQKYAMELLMKGEVVPGYKLVNKRSTRKWVDEEEVIAELKAKYDEDLLYETKLRSPAQMEKTFTDMVYVRDMCSKKTAKETAKEILKPLIVSPPGGVTMAREEDPRPVALPQGDAGTDFDDVNHFEEI